MRNSSAAKRAASSPPVPARISTITLPSSAGSRGSRSTFSSSTSRASSVSSRSISSRTRLRISSSAASSRRAYAPASSSRTRRSCRYASTTGSRRAISRPRRLIASTSRDVSGSASSALRSSYWRATSSRRVSRLAAVLISPAPPESAAGAEPGVSRRRAGASRDRGGGVGESLALRQLRAARDLLAVRLERLLHRDDGDLDLIVGRALRGDHLDEDAGGHDRAHERVRAVLRPEPQDLVADARDHRDQDEPPSDHHDRVVPAEEAEEEHRE